MKGKEKDSPTILLRINLFFPIHAYLIFFIIYFDLAYHFDFFIVLLLEYLFISFTPSYNFAQATNLLILFVLM